MTKTIYEKEIYMLCFFCMSNQFELPHEGYQPRHGEMVRCANCGRNNDYTSLTRVIDDEIGQYGQEIVEKLAKDFKDDLKKMFKGTSFITIK